MRRRQNNRRLLNSSWRRMVRNIVAATGVILEGKIIILISGPDLPTILLSINLPHLSPCTFHRQSSRGKRLMVESLGIINNDSIRNIHIILLAVVLGGMISINKITLFLNYRPEILRKSTCHFPIHYSHNFLQHLQLILRSFGPVQIRRSNLKHRLLMCRMVIRKILIEPNLHMPPIIQPNHLLVYIKSSHLRITIIKPPQTFTQHVQSLPE